MLVLTGCNKNHTTEMSDFNKVYGADIENIGTALEQVSNMKIYFGHQSVGYDMLKGLEAWEEETGVRIQKVESRDLGSKTDASLLHFRVGENKAPLKKIDDFVQMVDQIPKDEASVAFFKFCYIDFPKDADVDALFKVYKQKMLELKAQSGNCRIVLCTVPVTTLQKGPKALAKKVLGKDLNHSRENIRRNMFSDRIRTELGDDFPVFDLARVESTLPDGSTETFKYKGNYHPRLPEQYTRDQGHLNDFGAKIVSYNLIAFLSEL
jgi:hypothetical protein